MTIKLNEQNFHSVISSGTTLVDFYADWCGPCKMIAPIIEEIANERSDINVGKVNVDESGMLAMKYNVSSIPTIIVFKDGQEQAKIIGYRGKEEILSML